MAENKRQFKRSVTIVRREPTLPPIFTIETALPREIIAKSTQNETKKHITDVLTVIRLEMLFLILCNIFEIVTSSPLSKQIYRLRTVGLNLFAESSYVNVNGSGIAVIFKSPDFIKKLVAGVNAVGV